MSIRWRSVRPLLFLFTVGLLTSPSATAQTGAASLTGIVTDQSGATVPGATVTATNQATNVTYTAVSNEAGNYTVTSLPGRDVRRQGRAVQLQDGGDQADPGRGDADRPHRLQAGARRARRRPSRSAASRRCCRPSRRPSARSSRARTLSALPLNGRNTGQLSLLLPGVVSPNPSSFTAIRNFGGGRPFVNGNREQTNNYTIDGVDMNESIDNLVAYQPSPDALAEISVETNNYSADTGNVAGAVISNVIKSGTNSFHGNAFEFYRNSSMDANSWSNNRSSAAEAGAPAGHLRRHASADRWSRASCSSSATTRARGSTRPASRRSRWRRRPGARVTCRASPPTIRDPATGVAFAGNQIPLGRISPIARAILSNTSLYPLPNRVVSGVTGNYVGETLTTIRAHQARRARRLERVEQRQDLRTLLVSPSTSRRNDKRAFPLLLGNLTDAPFRNLAFNWNRIVSSSLVNELLVGYNQITIVADTLDWAGIGDANATFGIAGGQPIAGLSSIGLGQRTDS